jgi:hypothetical protein
MEELDLATPRFSESQLDVLVMIMQRVSSNVSDEDFTQKAEKEREEAFLKLSRIVKESKGEKAYRRFKICYENLVGMGGIRETHKYAPAPPLLPRRLR